MKYIYHHLGLGDHIICNGLVRSLISQDENYIMFVKPKYEVSVKFMYRDLKNLSFIPLDDNNDNVIRFLNENNVNYNDRILAGFGMHPNAIEFDDNFYVMHNIPFKNRWDKFFVDRDLEREKELFNHFRVNEGKYIFIHDDPSRGFVIDRSHIINKNMRIIHANDFFTDNIFDFCYLMENSAESHFIESAFKLIFDSLKLRNDNIFHHVNLLNNVIKDRITTSQSILNFKII